MTGRSKTLLSLIIVVLMIMLAADIFDYMLEPIEEKMDENAEVQAAIKVKPDDYSSMIETLEEKKDELTEKINLQTEQIENIESSMAFLEKEDVFNKVSEAVNGTGATFNNFYVTSEGTIKNDYSVQVRGDIYQINEFIQNICTDSAGISIGEFSIREDEESSFLTRYFDDSNALEWYDGTIYNASKIAANQEITTEDEELNTIATQITQKLPNAKDIQYVLTLTFRL